MLIKKKSLLVALISSVIISSVLILTLIGYVMYIELKGEDFKRTYQDLLQKVNAKVYAKNIEVSKLNAKIETAGPLKGNPIIEGLIKNSGYRNVTELLMKVKFLDQDGAIIYEVLLHPQEPSLGTGILTRVAIPYLYNPSKVNIKPNESLPFKKILAHCPEEILQELQRGSNKTPGKWSGKFTFEVLSVEF